MNLPAEFESYTHQLMGNDLYNQFVQALDDEPTPSIRLNRLKCPSAKVLLPAGQVPWYPDGYLLDNRPAFTFDPLLHAGVYYVQESSSMFLGAVLRQYVTKAVDMLDLCAAPGGKSTLARLELPAGSTLMCNEPVRNRAQILVENVLKCGHPEVIVTNSYPQDYRRSGLTFGVILCDVPCSGEGMFRKNEKAVDEWSVENVNNCQRLQREIVTDAWACLDEGGLLIYSTCTFNTKEDEENVAWICDELGATLLPVDTKTQWDIAPSLWKALDGPVYRFIPGYHAAPNKRYGEGLFMAVMRKNGTLTDKPHKESKQKGPRKQHANNDQYPTHLLKDAEMFQLQTVGTEVVAIPKTMTSTYETASKMLRILSAGITLGEQKGKDLIPNQSLALSTQFNQDAFPKVALSYIEALNYLRKEAIDLPADTPRGFVLVTYSGMPLGFVKNIGNRSNNLYPTEWRIRSSHYPENETKIIDIK